MYIHTHAREKGMTRTMAMTANLLWRPLSINIAVAEAGTQVFYYPLGWANFLPHLSLSTLSCTGLRTQAPSTRGSGMRYRTTARLLTTDNQGWLA